MTAGTRPVERDAERLWTGPDGTVCILAMCETPPFYLVSLVRDTEVLRERRLYGLASAQMLAQSWREGGPQIARSAADRRNAPADAAADQH
jgi:hypothetical protein